MSASVMPQSHSIWDRIKQGGAALFGAPAEMPLSPDERSAALRSGLMAAGGRLMAGPGNGMGEDFFQGLAGAVQAGQGAAATAGTNARATDIQAAAQRLVAGAVQDAHGDPVQTGRNLAQVYQRMIPLGMLDPAVRAIMQQFPQMIQALDQAPYLPGPDEQRHLIEKYPSLAKVPPQYWSKILPELATADFTGSNYQIVPVPQADGTVQVMRVKKAGAPGVVATGAKPPSSSDSVNLPEAQAAAGTLGDANKELTQLAAMNGVLSGSVPLLIGFGEAVAHRFGGNNPESASAAQGLGMKLMGRQKADWQSASWRWVHLYVSTLPKARNTPTMMTNIHQAFFAPPGVDDPETLQRYNTMRERATERIQKAFKDKDLSEISDLPGFEPDGAAPGSPRGPAGTPPPKGAGFDPAFWTGGQP